MRVPARAQVSYKVIPGVEVKEHTAKDISQGGIKFLVHEPVPKGSTLKIRLIAPESSFTFEALVKVVWMKELPSYEGGHYEVGVSFIDIPRDALERLVAFIRVFARSR